MASCREQVVEMFRGHGFSPELTTREVMHATGLSYSTCREALVMLAAEGVLKRKWIGKGWTYSRYVSY